MSVAPDVIKLLNISRAIRLHDGKQRRPEIHWKQFWLCAALRILPPIIFPIIQRWHGDKAKAEIKKAESGNQTRIAQINSN
jgi:hypothetical protein